MKFKIVYDQPHRLRIRFGKFILTKEQCFGLRDFILNQKGISFAEANWVNGSVLIKYDDLEARQKILNDIETLKLDEIPEGFATEEEKAIELEKNFKKKLAIQGGLYLLRRLIVPVPLRKFFTVYRAIPFIGAGLKALLHGKMTVEVLDATAIAAALGTGNFTTAGSTMFLLGLSDSLLEYSNARAKNALAQSLAVAVDQVWLVEEDGREKDIPIQDLQIGQVIRVRRGTMIPVDGTVVSGDALVNEASITGEPLAVHKENGQTVFAGTIIEDGEIDVEVFSLHSDSRISKIIEMIDTGEKEKANIQGRAERLADDIVPVSFGLFFTTLMMTGSFARALSVLMVDFSCAIKLSTPITIISALKEGVNHQVLVKGGKYLELLAQVDTIVFDKTGTLTNAVPKVAKIISTHKDYCEEKVLRISACLEEHFPHSVAAAIVETAKEKGVVHPEDHGKVEYIVAHGIATNYKGKRSIIGSYHFVFEDEGVPYPNELKEELEKSINGHTAVYLAVNQELVGVI